MILNSTQVDLTFNSRPNPCVSLLYHTKVKMLRQAICLTVKSGDKNLGKCSFNVRSGLLWILWTSRICQVTFICVTTFLFCRVGSQRVASHIIWWTPQRISDAYCSFFSKSLCFLLPGLWIWLGTSTDLIAHLLNGLSCFIPSSRLHNLC